MFFLGSAYPLGKFGLNTSINPLLFGALRMGIVFLCLVPFCKIKVPPKKYFLPLIGFSIFSLIVPEAHLLNIALLHEHQGKGLGRNLLEHTAFQSKTLGAKILFLEVRVSNKKAIRLYESMGFVKDAIRANYYSGKLKEDALLMSLKL